MGGPNCCQHGAFASKTFARPKENVCTAGNTAGYILVDVTVFVAEAPLLSLKQSDQNMGANRCKKIKHCRKFSNLHANSNWSTYFVYKFLASK